MTEEVVGTGAEQRLAEAGEALRAPKGWNCSGSSTEGGVEFRDLWIILDRLSSTFQSDLISRSGAVLSFAFQIYMESVNRIICGMRDVHPSLQIFMAVTLRSSSPLLTSLAARLTTCATPPPQALQHLCSDVIAHEKMPPAQRMRRFCSAGEPSGDASRREEKRGVRRPAGAHAALGLEGVRFGRKKLENQGECVCFLSGIAGQMGCSTLLN